MLTVRSEEVVGDIPWRPWAVRIQAERGCPGFLARRGAPGGQRAVPQARRKGATRRAIRYAQCVLAGRGAKCKRNLTYFEHPLKKQMLLTNQGAKYITHSDVS